MPLSALTVPKQRTHFCVFLLLVTMAPPVTPPPVAPASPLDSEEPSPAPTFAFAALDFFPMVSGRLCQPAKRRKPVSFPGYFPDLNSAVIFSMGRWRKQIRRRIAESPPIFRLKHAKSFGVDCRRIPRYLRGICFAPSRERPNILFGLLISAVPIYLPGLGDGGTPE